jgi:hypothetical protein
MAKLGIKSSIQTAEERAPIKKKPSKLLHNNATVFSLTKSEVHHSAMAYM